VLGRRVRIRRIMPDVTTVHTHVQASTIHVAVHVEIPNHELRAADAAEVLLCLSELAGLIAGSDYVDLAEADPAEAEKWKSNALVVNQMSIDKAWDILAVLPGCTPEQVQAFVEALTFIYMVVRDQQAGKKTEDEESLTQAAHVLIRDTSDVPRTPPIEKVREIVVRLAVLSLSIVDITIRRG
jgi:hypothetical protein